MPTIELQNNDDSKKSRKPASTTASVAASPGLWHYATVNGKARTYDRVGVNASGQEVYRDQNRRK